MSAKLISLLPLRVIRSFLKYPLEIDELVASSAEFAAFALKSKVPKVTAEFFSENRPPGPSPTVPNELVCEENSQVE